MSLEAPVKVYSIFIDGSPERVFDALIDPKFTARHFGGYRHTIEPRIGGVFTSEAPDGDIVVSGKVIVFDRPRKLACSWHYAEYPGMAPDIVTYELEMRRGATCLTVIEERESSYPESFRAGDEDGGWVFGLSAFKTGIETGKVLGAGEVPAASEGDADDT